MSRLHRAARLARVALARAERPRGRRRPLALAAGLVAIVAWQAAFASRAGDLDRRFTVTASSGVWHESDFVYFLYYLGLYPVATLDKNVEYSEAGARRLLDTRGRSLVMDNRRTFRSGDRGRVFLYLFDAWLKGVPRRLSLHAADGAAWTLALCALWTSFWAARRPLLGALAVVLLGSDPFQLHEVYGRENVFGWPITTATLLLALHVPWLDGRSRSVWRVAIPAVATGALLAAVRTVRSEPTALILAPAAVYLALDAPWVRRAALAGALAASFVVASLAIGGWLRAKFSEAEAAVNAAGGHPYPGEYVQYHELWHPIWCGLGDFDHKYGYAWSDDAAVTWARPVLRERYGVEIPPFRPLTYWDADKRYLRRPSEYPHYHDVIRDKVLHDITHDPAWYAGILARRAWRLATQTTPVRAAFGARFLRIPMHGLLALALLALLIRLGRRFAAGLVAFVLPLGVPAFAIYSDRGMSFYSCYHVLAAAVLLAALVEAARLACGGLRRYSSTRPDGDLSASR